MTRERIVVIVSVLLLLPLVAYAMPAVLGITWGGASMWKQSFITPVVPRVNSLIKQANQYLSDDSLTVVFRHSDFGYYGRGRMIDHNDMRLIHVFQAPTTEAAWQALRQLGVTHLFLPPYNPPTVYNTPVHDLLGDPRFTTVIYNAFGYRLFTLNDTIIEPNRQSITAGPIKLHPELWKETLPNEWLNTPFEQLVFLSGAAEQPRAPEASPSRVVVESFKRQRVLVGTEISDAVISTLSNQDAINNNRFAMASNGRYELYMDAQGFGLVSVMVYEYTMQEGKRIADRPILVDQIILTGERRTIRGQFLTSGGAQQYQVVVELSGRGAVGFEGIHMSRLLPPEPPRDDSAKQR